MFLIIVSALQLIPSRFRPSYTYANAIRAIVGTFNNTSHLGYAQLTGSGVVTIYMDLNGSNFTNGATIGIVSGFFFSYCV
jgi:hypothetical protein